MNVFEYRDPSISILHCLDEKPCSYAMHTHAFAELYCFLQGKVTYYVEGNSYALQPGDILLMRPAEAHYIDVDPTAVYERLYINFDIRLFDMLERDNTLLRPYFDRRAGTRNHYSADEICTHYLRGVLQPEGSRATRIANLVLLMERLCHLFGAASVSADQPDTLEYRLIRFINHNLDRELSTQFLCERFFLSPAQLCRRFHNATGTSVGRYVTTKRLLLARQLLLQGQKPLKVCTCCGYKDYATFFRAYKRYFGHTPKDASSFSFEEDRAIIC